MLNMLYKTHAVKSEPIPIRLSEDCDKVINQRTLFGAIRSFAPEQAKEIQARNPEKLFWKCYEKAYNSFDSKMFVNHVIKNIHHDYYHLDVEEQLANFPKQTSDLAKSVYHAQVNKMMTHFEQQDGKWEKRGLSKIHKRLLLFQSIQSISANGGVYTLATPSEWWPKIEPHRYIKTDFTYKNQVEDISWKPNSED